MVNNIRTTPFCKLRIFAGKFNEMKVFFPPAGCLLDSVRKTGHCSGYCQLERMLHNCSPTTRDISHQVHNCGISAFFDRLIINATTSTQRETQAFSFCDDVLRRKLSLLKSTWIIIYHVFLFGQRPIKKAISCILKLQVRPYEQIIRVIRLDEQNAK